MSVASVCTIRRKIVPLSQLFNFSFFFEVDPTFLDTSSFAYCHPASGCLRKFGLAHNFVETTTCESADEVSRLRLRDLSSLDVDRVLSDRDGAQKQY